MAVGITIGGISRTTSCRFESLKVINTTKANADIAELVVSLPNNPGWRPKVGNEVIVTNGAAREFAGFLIDLDEEWIAGTRLVYKCQCKDYLYLLNRKLVADYSSALAGSSAPTADAIIKTIVSNSTDGFSSTGVLAAPAVAAETYNYVPPGDIIRKLADQVGYGWWIDYSKVVNFAPSATLLAPVASINIDTNVVDYGDMVIHESASNVKNRVFVQGWKQRTTSTYSQSFAGNAASQFWYWGYEPSAIADITATINTVALTVRTDGIDGAAGSTVGSSSQVFACFSNLGFRMSQYTPTSTETLAIASNYMNPGFTVIESGASQTDFATREATDGVHEYNINHPGLTANDGSNKLAFLHGSAIITRDAPARLAAKFVSYTQGWKAGQSLTLVSTNRMGGLNQVFYVQEVRKRLINHPGTAGVPTLYYEITVSDSALAQ